jgi:hypothetical protein
MAVVLTGDAVANSVAGGLLTIGSDGTNYRVVVTDTAGVLKVNAIQSGTWNITNVSGTVSLPTGAATAAKQPALGTAGTASSDVITIQGIAGMTAVKVDGSGVTQPVSIAATVAVDSELPAAAAQSTDNISAPTAPQVYSHLLAFNGTAYERVRTANTGRLQVDVVTGGGVDTPTTPAFQPLSSSALAAGASANLDTTDVQSKYCWGADFTSSVAFKVVFSTLANGVATPVTTLFGSPGQLVSWRPPSRKFMQSGSSAGADGFRAAFTNMDTSDAADVYATVFYADN